MVVMAWLVKNVVCLYIYLCLTLPYLHATTPAAHVFPQQQAVESGGRDEVGELVEGLLHLCRGQILTGQSRVKGSQLPQHRRHGGSISSHSPGVWARSLSGCYQLHRRAGQAWDDLALQQSRNWGRDGAGGEIREAVEGGAFITVGIVVVPMMFCSRFSVMERSCW